MTQIESNTYISYKKLDLVGFLNIIITQNQLPSIYRSALKHKKYFVI